MGIDGQIIASLSINNYRSYHSESFEFNDGVNIIVGPNASGKSNLLEAILMLCLGNSYRARDNELITFNKSFSRLEATMSDNTVRIMTLTPKDDTVEKQFKIHGQTFKRLSINKSLPSVLFEPSHLLVLNGSPSLRRKYLDDLLSQTISGYSGICRQYQRCLAQRNAILKGRSSPGSLFAWNVRLSELGGRIVEQRLSLLEAIADRVKTQYRRLSNTGHDVKLEYQSELNTNSYASQLLRKLETTEDEDYRRGFTYHGPHRDDLIVHINDHPVQQSASRGECRTIMLVFKVVEAEIIEKSREAKPLLLLDDVFSELDGARRQALTEFFQPYQTFITTTDADIIQHHFANKAAIISLA